MTINLARPGYRPPLVPPYKPVAALRKATAQSMRKLADDMKSRHPEMGAHHHIRDAAAALDRNQPEGAVRHLNAAIGNMTPQSLRRHGLLTDDHHDAAKRSMDAIHRHLLLVKDVQDTQAYNNQLPRQGDSSPEPGDDSLDERPTARQPFEKALNAPARTNSGGPDPAVAKPVALTDPHKSKQVAASNGDLTTAIELVGPKGYIHGWIKAAADSVARSALTAGVMSDPDVNAPIMRDIANITSGAEHEQILNNVTPANAVATVQQLMSRGMSAQDAAKAVTAKLKEKGKVNQSLQELKSRGQYGGTIQTANGDLTTAIGLSADTARLASVPHPFGKPGGPGLWHVKDMELPPYVQNIAHALLRTGRAKTLSEAIAIARGATKRWEVGKNTKPEVRAASAASDADWRAKQARAHAHSNQGDAMTANRQLAAKIIELAYNPMQPRGRDGKWSRGAGLSAIDRALVKSHRASQAAETRSSMKAAPGSAEHAAELRRLATEADAHQQHNYATLRGSAEGPASREATSVGSGTDRPGAPESDTGRALRRAATMIDRKQPSLARVHAGTLRSAAVAERADPAYSGRLAAAADKLSALPKGHGLAALPAATPEYRSRTAAAQKYAAGGSALARAQAGANHARSTARARAGASRNIAASWETGGRQELARRIIELTGTAAGAAQDSRTPLGTFGSGGGSKTTPATSSKGGPRTTKAATAKAPAKTSSNAQKKAALIKQAAGYRAKADALIAQRDALRKALASASGKTSSGQAGSTTSSGASTTKSSAATTPSSTASTSSTAAKSSTASTSKSTTAASSTSAAGLKSQIAALNTQIVQLQNQYRAAMAQAKAL
jgi:uncharacterized protein YoaH (UPF0181 family)